MPDASLHRTGEGNGDKPVHRRARRSAWTLGSMRRTHIITALLTTAVSLTDAVSACSCMRPDLSELYGESEHVSLAEVVDLRVDSSVVSERGTFVCVATLRPIESFKAPEVREFRVQYSVSDRSECGEPPVPIPATQEVIVSTCGPHLELSERYLVFVPESARIEIESMCDPRIHYDFRIRMDFMRELRDGA